jgi:8-oxo-dGTP diphosphatase
MSEEYLDIVDENGNPTGKKELRSVVHEKGLWHWVAVIYFYRVTENKNIELLIHLRSKFKDQQPNKWAPRFGGHIEAGKSAKETAIKEVREEIGIIISPNKLIPGIKNFYNSINNREIGQAYYYEFNENIDKLSFNDDEVQEVKWMDIDEIIDSMKKNPEIWASNYMSLQKMKQDLF